MRYNCGLIGCGRIGCGFDDKPSPFTKTHIGAYRKCNRTKLCAISDIDKSKLRKYGKKYKIVNTYTNYKKMLENEELDVISVCTLVDSHLEIIEKAIKTDVKAIFLEKPISNTLRNAMKITNLCKKNNVKLLLDYQRRFIPAYFHLKNFMDAGKLGKIQKITVEYGGGIANTCSHVFDILLLFFWPSKIDFW